MDILALEMTVLKILKGVWCPMKIKDMTILLVMVYLIFVIKDQSIFPIIILLNINN